MLSHCDNILSWWNETSYSMFVDRPSLILRIKFQNTKTCWNKENDIFVHYSNILQTMHDIDMNHSCFNIQTNRSCKIHPKYLPSRIGFINFVGCRCIQIYLSRPFSRVEKVVSKELDDTADMFHSIHTAYNHSMHTAYNLFRKHRCWWIPADISDGGLLEAGLLHLRIENHCRKILKK